MAIEYRRLHSIIARAAITSLVAIGVRSSKRPRLARLRDTSWHISEKKLAAFVAFHLEAPALAWWPGKHHSGTEHLPWPRTPKDILLLRL